MSEKKPSIEASPPDFLPIHRRRTSLTRSHLVSSRRFAQEFTVLLRQTVEAKRLSGGKVQELVQTGVKFLKVSLSPSSSPPYRTVRTTG